MKKKNVVAFTILIILLPVSLLWYLFVVRQNNDQIPFDLFSKSTTSVDNQLPLMEREGLKTSVATTSITKLIETNGDCQFPCFWGITPGKTKWSDAIDHFEQLDIHTERGITFSNYEYLIVLVDYNNLSFRLNIYKDVYQKEEFVAAILVDISKTPGGVNDISSSNHYSLKDIFANLGKPTTLQFQIDNPPTYDTPEERLSTVKGYSLWVVYEEIDMMIDYVGGFDASVDSEICPEFMANNIVIYLLSPQGFPRLDDIYTQPPELSDVTVLSEAEKNNFYQQTLKTQEIACYDFLTNDNE